MWKYEGCSQISKSNICRCTCIWRRKTPKHSWYHATIWILFGTHIRYIFIFQLPPPTIMVSNPVGFLFLRTTCEAALYEVPLIHPRSTQSRSKLTLYWVCHIFQLQKHYQGKTIFAMSTPTFSQILPNTSYCFANTVDVLSFDDDHQVFSPFICHSHNFIVMSCKKAKKTHLMDFWWAPLFVNIATRGSK